MAMDLGIMLEQMSHKATRDLTDQMDAYLLDMASKMNLTIEQLAQDYELEMHPLETTFEDGRYQATQTVRLKRKDDR